MSEKKMPKCKRRVFYKDRQYGEFITAAKNYVDNLAKEELEYIYRKPYDPMPYNGDYYQNMYGLLGLLQAMKIKPRGKVLEVGSGPGWVTEILVGLGYSVEAVEPSETFLNIARERVSNFIRHLHLSDPPPVVFHCTTLEECSLNPGEFDGVIFFDALHHIVDENVGLEKCYHLLSPGGVIGIHENAWVPQDREQEKLYQETMKRFGTLESLFSEEYLDYLLGEKGFIQLERYHQINGFFPAALENIPIGQAAQTPAGGNNILTAIKPYGEGPTTEDPQAHSAGEITVLQSSFSREKRLLELSLCLKNTGDTIWLYRHSSRGVVSTALYRGTPGMENFQEAKWRFRLPCHVLPGSQVEFQMAYELPPDYDRDIWKLDLVNEGFFWFSQKGTAPREVSLKNI
ncbi:class I SAM-dependent methyltransferase [Candidatus Contubernalis alkaliaceticus]|uniref:class I SAM-dependent methyltransferase n=1 Tax=Candidatus Contubernalis alkaliaceticus TaxID=338645 RepID=UPI001F4BFB06|nr:class I SAM-dependent methyltransferase [Candidatus Contubernalis alkalaceticus]UNC93599.1 class I SAM-dependent methyltransferase [Candidatus Contubernalis alkalaceticus]